MADECKAGERCERCDGCERRQTERALEEWQAEGGQ